MAAVEPTKTKLKYWTVLALDDGFNYEESVLLSDGNKKVTSQKAFSTPEEVIAEVSMSLTAHAKRKAIAPVGDVNANRS